MKPAGQMTKDDSTILAFFLLTIIKFTKKQYLKRQPIAVLVSAIPKLYGKIPNDIIHPKRIHNLMQRE
jgi:hypothetical protein